MKTEAASSVVQCQKCRAANRVRVQHAVGKAPVCGRCGAVLPEISTVPVTVTDSNFAEVVERSTLPVLLDMWAAWCGPCRMVAPTVEALAAELAGRVVVGKMDVDENPNTAGRFGVQSIPTLLILVDGKEAGRIVGVQTRNAILNHLQPHIK